MILNIYKEKDWTSFDVVAKLRGILKIRKIGHAGTLDPLAEGVLILLTEKDTKKQNEIMQLQKEYIAEIALGAYSETYDLEKIPAFENTTSFDTQEILDVFPRFTGTINQKVPAYSAVKVKGKTLYKLARKGALKNTEIPTKTITIYNLELLDLYKKEITTEAGVKNLQIIKLKVTCSSGTYIRSLANDLGEALGTKGVLASLIRSRVGDYKIENAKKVSEF